MNSEKCPICGNTVSNLLQHLVLLHNIKDSEDLRKNADPRIPSKECKEEPMDISIDWNTEFYKILSKLSSEKRTIFIEKELDDLLVIIDRVENDAIIGYGRSVLSNLNDTNEVILEKKTLLLNKL